MDTNHPAELLDFSIYPNLEEVVLRCYESLSSTKGLEKCLKLKKLEFDAGYGRISELPDFSVCPNLEKIVLRSCENLSSIKALEKYPTLKKLEITNLPDLLELPNFSTYSDLEEFVLGDCKNLSSIKDLEKCSKLKKLKLYTENHRLLELPNFNAFPNLEKLVLCGYENLTAIRGLENCLKLKRLILPGCRNLSGILDLSAYPNLEEIDITYCENLRIIGREKCKRKIQIVRQHSSYPSPSLIAAIPSITAPMQKAAHHIDVASAIDFNTFSDPHTTLHAKELLVDYQGRHPPINNYRKDVANEVVWSKETLKLQARLSYDTGELKNIVELKYMPHDNLLPSILQERQYWGEVPLDLTSDNWTALPSLNPHDKLCALENNLDLAVSWCPVSSQYLVKLKAGGRRQIKLRYIMETPILPEVALPPKVLPLPEGIEHGLKIALQQEPLLTLANTIAKTTDLAKRIALLQVYCSNFDYTQALRKDAELTVRLVSLDLPLEITDLLHLLIQRQGACRHCSYAFLILATHYHIPCRTIDNDIHMFVEVWNDGTWKKLNLGGAPSNLEVERLPQITDTTTTKLPAPIVLPIADISTPTKELVALLDQPDFTQTLEETSSFYELCLHIVSGTDVKSGNILLRGIDEELAPIFHSCLLDVLKSKKQPYLYLHQPDDLRKLLSELQISAGKYRNLPGVLTTLINSGGLLVINWNTFTPNEMATYKSLLDTPPTLHGRPVNPAVKVIGLLATDTVADEDFTSRWLTAKVSPSLVRELQDKEAEHQSFWKVSTSTETTPDAIDLYDGALDWKTALLGRISISAGKMEFIPGVLGKGEQHQICLINPPLHDEEFKLFWDTALRTREIKINGKVVFLPEDFKLTVASKTASKFDVVVCKPENLPQESVFFVTRQTFSNLFPGYRVNDSGQVEETSGYLADFGTLVITADIKLGQWRRLVDAVAASGKKIEIKILAGVEIDGVISREASEISKQPKLFSRLSVHKRCATILSDDPSLTTSQFTQKSDCVVIPISKHTTFGDLVRRIKLQDHTSKAVDEACFTVEYAPMWRQLQEGKTVILRGEISQELYDRLASLFLTDPPRIFIDGKATAIKGRLFLVLPNQEEPAMPLRTNIEISKERVVFVTKKLYQHTNISDDDYWIPLTTGCRFHSDNVVQILGFCSLAQQVPSLVPGAKKFALSLASLTGILTQLEKDQEKPEKIIKRYLLREYWNGNTNEAFAYLDVMAKLLFGKHTNDNYQKIRSYVHRIEDIGVATSQLFWQLANCLGIDTLREIFNFTNITELKNLLHDYAKMHIVLSRLQITIAASLQLDLPCANPKLVTALDKQQQRVKDFLQDSTASHPLILAGTAGTGKTHLTLQLRKEPGIRLCCGLEAINDWQACRDTGITAVLLIDEYNLLNSGTLRFLSLPLDPQHKVILTGNPQNYGNRNELDADIAAETLFFKQPTDEDLRTKILLPQLSTKKIGVVENVNKIFLFAYRYVQRYIDQKSLRIGVSMRDLEMLCLRLFTLLNAHPESDIQWLALTACEHEFGGILHAAPKRLAQVMAEEFSLPFAAVTVKYGLMPLPKFGMTDSRMQVLNLVEETLRIRDYDFTTPEPTARKSGILIEGPSGIGKSALLCAYLEAKGFVLSELPKPGEPIKPVVATDVHCKKYYHITVGSGAEEILSQAFHEGAIVVLNELNLNASLEKKLNQYLSGVDENQRPAENCGFTVFATQNPLTFSGRESLSPSLSNRFHYIHMSDFSRDEYITLAGQAGLNTADANYLYEKTKDRGPREFFRRLDELAYSFK